MSNKKILFSGIQPTGEIHIGNYLGALKNWVDLQSQYQCFYSVVDLHAITIDQDPQAYQEKIFDTAMDLLAIGIDPKKSVLFIQSQLPEHTELCWLLNTLTPIAELERMTQYKDKSRQNQKNINVGLLDYPVLQAADILLYQTDVVPVGEDQLQHLELTNMIARKFNNRYGQYFKEIKPIVGLGARVMSLTEPDKKMSKSLGPNNYIALGDYPEVIRKKVMSAVTDMGPDTTEMSKGVKNLFDLLNLFGDQKNVQKFQTAYDQKTLKYSELKTELAGSIIKILKPIQDKKARLIKEKVKVKKILVDGAKKARTVAQKTLKEVKQKMGLA